MNILSTDFRISSAMAIAGQATGNLTKCIHIRRLGHIKKTDVKKGETWTPNSQTTCQLSPVTNSLIE